MRHGPALVSSGYVPPLTLVDSGYANGVTNSVHLVNSNPLQNHASIHTDETAKFYQSQTFAPRAQSRA